MIWQLARSSEVTGKGFSIQRSLRQSLISLVQPVFGAGRLLCPRECSRWFRKPGWHATDLQWHDKDDKDGLMLLRLLRRTGVHVFSATSLELFRRILGQAWEDDRLLYTLY